MSKQIPLTGQNGEGKFALVDDEDYAAASAYTWHTSHGYVSTKIDGRKNRKRIFLHNLIFGDPPPGLLVDHIDGDPLNNQRANLHWATHAQNAYNRPAHKNTSSSFKGVSWNNRWQLWIAQIQFNKTKIHLGRFMFELDAARAYNEAAVRYFGEYARLNVIPDDAPEAIHYRQAAPSVRSRTSKYRGVSFAAREERWQASIGVKYKNIRLGYFDSEEQAARAYDTAAKLHRGNRAYLNFPD